MADLERVFDAGKAQTTYSQDIEFRRVWWGMVQYDEYTGASGEVRHDEADELTPEGAEKLLKYLGPKVKERHPNTRGIKTCKWCFSVFPIEEEHDCPVKRQITALYE